MCVLHIMWFANWCDNDNLELGNTKHFLIAENAYTVVSTRMTLYLREQRGASKIKLARMLHAALLMIDLGNKNTSYFFHTISDSVDHYFSLLFAGLFIVSKRATRMMTSGLIKLTVTYSLTIHLVFRGLQSTG